MEKINIDEKLALFSDHWNPRLIGELNGQCVKLSRLKGSFVWHKHVREDELFYVLDGELKIEFREETVILQKNEMIIIPRGTEHRPVAEEEVVVMIFEPCSTINTGNNPGEFTRLKPEKI